MVDVSSWVAIALAWLTALFVEQPASVVRGDCFCNCSCETQIQGLSCPEGSWVWEFSKILIVLVLGIVLGTCQIISILFTLVLKVLGVGVAWARALATPTTESTSRAPEIAIEAGDNQERARRQLEALRLRKAVRA